MKLTTLGNHRDSSVFRASSYEAVSYIDEKHEITEYPVDTNHKPRWAGNSTYASKLLVVARWAIMTAIVVILAIYHFYPSMSASNRRLLMTDMC
jgi:endothelin-converting enzyme